MTTNSSMFYILPLQMRKDDIFKDSSRPHTATSDASESKRHAASDLKARPISALSAMDRAAGEAVGSRGGSAAGQPKMESRMSAWSESNQESRNGHSRRSSASNQSFLRQKGQQQAYVQVNKVTQQVGKIAETVLFGKLIQSNL